MPFHSRLMGRGERGRWGDQDLIVKQQSLTGFDVKLTLMGIALD
ncbi:MAG: hypothetical protein QQW96_03015 [Tychonema bourrellyi B0820]|nr:hypothetical protein [Tychonema bourrellyi]MDQ2096601.1 hypothetical protein [Tychonema bourrellyi B0820]